MATYNEAANIGRCLSSVADIADEIIVVDGGSTDNTAALARNAGATVIVTNNPPVFHINKQKALDASHGTWILQLDADEVVGPDLKEEIKDVITSDLIPNGYYLARHNYFLGDWLRKGGQYPDYVMRLFRNGKGVFPQKSVHEQIVIEGEVGHLMHPLEHYSYTTARQYWAKSAAYIRLGAAELKASGRNRAIGVAISYLLARPFATFFALYVRHKGFVDGWRGFVYALFSAMHFPKTYFMSLKLS